MWKLAVSFIHRAETEERLRLQAEDMKFPEIYKYWWNDGKTFGLVDCVRSEND